MRVQVYFMLFFMTNNNEFNWNAIINKTLKLKYIIYLGEEEKKLIYILLLTAACLKLYNNKLLLLSLLNFKYFSLPIKWPSPDNDPKLNKFCSRLLFKYLLFWSLNICLHRCIASTQLDIDYSKAIGGNLVSSYK